MSAYLILKHLHMTAAYLTVTLFALRLLLDAVGRPGWRQTPLRWIPHANDTVLLVAAISLLFVTPWMPFVHGWLTAKIFLLVGYIVAGLFALKPGRSTPVRVTAAILALVQVAAIFHLAMAKPVFGA
ncbi:SirB2 family protein [Marinobacter profundi]|uniref:Invasion protein n=1 Tax=Marinobacter profundi TaxID=2666256 RepID=A0A2G1UMN4_9GAMM|nr:SirB2 family protein [Marinobacter profundi]PHQ15766.1 invasion protein [Marinobacter profundi]